MLGINHGFQFLKFWFSQGLNEGEANVIPIFFFTTNIGANLHEISARQLASKS